MSEKIYACLLRLYPSCFRQAYGDDALQLFRDRSHHERRFFSRLRLWFDLLADLVISLPRQYSVPSLVGAAAQPYPGGRPTFQSLDGESLHPRALLLGTALSVVAFGACSILISLGGQNRGGQHLGGQASALLLPFQGHSEAHSEEISGEVDAAERTRVIQASIANLKQFYIDPEIARKIADALLAHEKNGDYVAMTHGVAFADLLTKQMRDLSHDKNLVMVYSKAVRPDRPPGPTPEGIASYRKAMEQSNCTIGKATILPHNIGYLKLDSFPDPSVCETTATSAMASLNHADAVIFDVRENRGGFPKMVSLIASYLFDHPEYLYNPRENTTEQSWTKSPVPGSRLADKPVYVLISRTTLSGAEQFSCDLKMLKRATLVGETTGGSAHAGTYHRIDDHFGMGLTETKAINPFSIKGWDGTGVEPDIKVRAVDALETAKKLAEIRLQKR